MANRHLSRSLLVQTLFEWDFNSLPPVAAPVILKRDSKEFAPGLDDDFALELLESVLKHQSEIDDIIRKAAPEWPFEKIAIIDRNILRVGLCELLFADRSEVPARVAINEAIELAKTFGGESSGKFVNGVLGTVYKEIGEPGKDEVPAKKRRGKDINYDDLPLELLTGAVVYAHRPEDNALMLALVHDIFGYWTLSKGRLKEGEDPKDGAARKTKEELNIGTVKVKADLGANEYVASDPKKGKIKKRVVYYLAEAEYVPLKLEPGKGGLDEVKWFPAEEVLDLKIYDDILPIIAKSLEKLSKQKHDKHERVA